jgi:hypothetical protein
MDSRFHGNDTNAIIVIPAKAGIHPTQDSFPRYLPKSRNFEMLLIFIGSFTASFKMCKIV